MKYYGKKSFASMLKLMLNVTLVIGALAAALIMYSTIMKGQQDIGTANRVLIVCLLIIGISCVFLIVIDLRRVIGSLVNSNPFIPANVRALKRVAIECFIIAATYIMNLIFNSNLKEFQFIYVDSKGIHTDMEFFIFIFAGCFIAILSKVFEQAVQYKEENDLVI